MSLFQFDDEPNLYMHRKCLSNQTSMKKTGYENLEFLVACTWCTLNQPADSRSQSLKDPACSDTASAAKATAKASLQPRRGGVGEC